MMTSPSPQLPLWQCRARHVGFKTWKGRELAAMTEKEIEAAFAGLAREFGISYVWCDGRR